jgi:hypothetical protein
MLPFYFAEGAILSVDPSHSILSTRASRLLCYTRSLTQIVIRYLAVLSRSLVIVRIVNRKTASAKADLSGFPDYPLWQLVYQVRRDATGHKAERN